MSSHFSREKSSDQCKQAPVDDIFPEMSVSAVLHAGLWVGSVGSVPRASFLMWNLCVVRALHIPLPLFISGKSEGILWEKDMYRLHSRRKQSTLEIV